MHAYLRLQAESTGIIALCATDWATGTAWRNTDGKSFHDRYHSRTVTKLRDVGLYKYYDAGSNIAVHSRFGGVAAGLAAGQKSAKPGESKIVFQEAGNEAEIFWWFCVYLDAHRDILNALTKVLPEVDFTRVGLREYSEMVDSFQARLRPYLARL
jgi:hypothetical protein